MERSLKKRILISSILLSVIICIVVLTIICVNNRKFNEKGMNKIEIAANKYFNDNGYDNNDYAEVSIQTLVDGNYISEDDVTAEQLKNGVVSISNTSADDNSKISVGYALNTNSYDNNITIGDYNATVTTYSSSSTSTFESYIDEETNEQIFKINSTEFAHSRFMLSVSGDTIKNNSHNIFVVRAQVRAENITYTQSYPKGASLMVMYYDNGYSWSFSREDVKNSSEWKTIDIVVIPEYNVETETNEDARIPLYLALGGTLSSEYVAGTAYFKNIEIINAEDETDVLNLNDDEKLDITYSKNNRIKYVSYLHERERKNISVSKLQERVNTLEEVYESYAELVGNSSSGKHLYPYKANTLVILQTNKLQTGYGGLANYPIMLTYNCAINIYNGTDRSFEFGILHEMGHTFDHILTSDDGTVNNGGGKWNFHSEMWANMKIFYALYTKNITAIKGGKNLDYFDLLELFKPSETTGFHHDNLNYFIYNSITDYENKTVNFDVMKKIHQWFNDCDFSFTDVSRRLIYFLSKFDEYSNDSFKNSVTESYFEIVANQFDIISATSENVDSVVQIQNITTIPLNSYAIKPFVIKEGVNDVVFYSSDESIATIDENGVVKTFDKEGTVTFTVKSYFNDAINKSVEINILGDNGDKVWNISKDTNNNVIAYFDEPTNALVITGEGKTKNFSYNSVKPWVEFKNMIKHVIIDDGITYVGEYLFKSHSTLESVTMSDTVLEIGQYAFELCKSLKNVKFSSNLKIIGRTAFKGTAIEEIILPETIESLGHNVFWECNNIKSLYIPNKTIKLGSNVFALSTLNIPVVFAGKDIIEIENFDLVERLLDDNDFIHSSKSLTYKRCSYNTNTQLVNITLEDAKKGNATIAIPADSGLLSYFTINFIPEILPLDHLKIDKEPNTINYITGESFDSEGMIIKAVFKSDSGEIYEKIIDNYKISQNDNLTTGQNEVLISYTFDGITKTISQPINVVDELNFNIKGYNIINIGEEKYIEGIKTPISINQILNLIETNGNIEFYKENNKIVNYSSNIFTNLTINVTLGKQTERYKVILTGDLNGDSYINTGDLLKIYRYTIGTFNSTENYFLKASLIDNDKTIDKNDVDKLFNYLINKINNL